MSPTLKSTGVGHFVPKFRVFPLEQTRRVGVAKSEHPRLTNGEIIFRRIPTYAITIHQRHRQTDGQTDRRRDRRHAIAIPRFALKCIAR